MARAVQAWVHPNGLPTYQELTCTTAQARVLTPLNQGSSLFAFLRDFSFCTVLSVPNHGPWHRAASSSHEEREPAHGASPYRWL
jgi:hypothetical protein